MVSFSYSATKNYLHEGETDTKERVLTEERDDPTWLQQRGLSNDLLNILNKKSN